MLVFPVLLACAPVDNDDTTPQPTTDTTDTGDQVGNDIDVRRHPPVVVATSPPSGALGVDPGTTRLEVTFSESMSLEGWAWVSVDSHFPDEGDASVVSYVDSDTNVLDGVVLSPDHGYMAWINSPYGMYTDFADLDGDPAVAYPLVFATGNDPALLADFPPAVVGSDPPALAEDVDPGRTSLTFVFSKDMRDGFGALSEDRRQTWPEVGQVTFTDARTAEVEVTLEPSTTYAVWVEAFVDTDGNEVARWLLAFRTADR